MKALKYLHEEAGIIHRDIKPQNILLCADDENRKGDDVFNFTAKLCDFGVSEKLEDKGDDTL